MPTLVHRGTGLAINADGKVPIKPPGDSTASTHPSAHNSSTSQSGGGDSTDLRADENSIVLSTSADPSSVQSLIKRTKKIAKPRISTRATTSSISHHARNVVIESICKWGESSSQSFGLGESNKSISRLESDDAVQSLTRPTQEKRKKGQEGLNHTPKGKDENFPKIKKRMQTIFSAEKLLKNKQAKKSKSDKTVKVRKSKTTTNKRNVQQDEIKSTANRRVKPKKRVRSPKKSDADELNFIVSVVIDRVAEEIRHCASFFVSDRSRAVVIIGSEDRESRKEQSAVSTAVANSTREFYQDEQLTSQPLNVRVNDDRIAGQNESSGSTGYSSNILPRSDEENYEGKQKSTVDVQGANLVIVAVRRFVLEVYCPYLLSAKRNSGNTFPNIDRIHLSTLLVIREMLIMNADNLFTFSNLKRLLITMSERMHLSRIFADAIVRNAAKRLHLTHQPDELRFDEKFLQAMNDYDTSGEAFQFSLAPIDAQTVCAYQGGREMGSEESIVAKVGFNYARERHPLLVNRGLIMKNNDGTDNELVPRERRDAEPSACWLLCMKDTIRRF